MSEIEALLFLLGVTTFLVSVARRIGLPYPILLVLGGLVVSAIPRIPNIALKPEYVFVLILPPILQSAAFFTPIRDFRASLRPIFSLAVGLVIATVCAVAVVAHALVHELSWAEAFILGAVVAPPDAVAATSVADRLGLPRRVVTILEGESLVNDASALVSYRVAVAAATTGAFSFGHAFGEFVLATAAGIAVGVVAGVAIRWLLLQTEDASVLIAITLLAPYATYLLAEHLHGSGVLAVVAEGLMMGRVFFKLRNPEARLQSLAFWDMFVFLLNGFVFILIGVQLTDVLHGISGWSASSLALYAAAVCVTAIALRFVWIFLFGGIRRLRMVAAAAEAPSRPELAVIGWTGMRGVVSLAGALALESDVRNRELIVFLTFCVILVTLVGQGLTLAPLIRWLGLGGSNEAEHEERLARQATTAAAMQRLHGLAQADWAADEVVEDLRTHLHRRARRLAAEDAPGEHGAESDVSDVFLRLQRELLEAEEAEATRLRDRGVINDATLRRLQRDLDAERLRLQRA